MMKEQFFQMVKEADQGTHEKLTLLKKTMDSGFKQWDTTLERASENNGQQTKDEENTSTWLFENKHNRNNDNNKHIESDTKGVKNRVIYKIKKIEKLHHKKIINTQEGLEMIKSGLVKVHNIPITEPREVSQFRNAKRTSSDFPEELVGAKKPKLTKEHGILTEIMREQFVRLRGKMEKTVKKTLEMFIEDNKKRRKESCQRINGIHKRMKENHRPWMIEKLPHQRVKKELTMTEVVQTRTEDCDLNEHFVAAKWKSRMIRRYFTSTEINLDTKIIRCV